MQRTDFWTQWEKERVRWFERVALKHIYYQVSPVAQLVKNPPAMQETWFDSWVRKIPWRRDRLPTPVFLGIPCGSAGKESACNVGDLGLIPGLGRSLEKGKATHSSTLAWRIPWTCIVHGVAKSQTGLSDFHFHVYYPM